MLLSVAAVSSIQGEVLGSPACVESMDFSKPRYPDVEI
jgi:hypothetical protein